MSEPWRNTPLGDLCSFISGSGFPEHLQGRGDGELPFYKVSDMSSLGNERFLIKANNYVSRELARKRGWKTAPVNAVVFAKVGAALLLNRRRMLSMESIIDNNMIAVVANDLTTNDWLYWQLLRVDFADFVQDGALPSINQRQLGNIPVPKVGSNESFKITQILDTLDTAIHETEAIIAKLKAVKQGLLHDLLTRGIDANGELRPPQAEAPHLYKESPLGWIPKQWEVQSLGCMAEVSRGKFTHRPRNDPRFYGGKHPFIQTGDVAAAEGELVSTYSQTLSDRGISVSQEFPAGTIAITIAANIADTAILAIPMYFPDSVVGAIVHPKYNIRFVELSIRKAKRMLDARAPQSAQKNINLQDLRPLLVAVPERAEQDAIASKYDALQSQLQSEQEALEKYRYEKIGLMDDLLTGRVRVTPLLEASPSFAQRPAAQIAQEPAEQTGG